MDRSARALKLRDRLLLITRTGLVVVLAAAAAAPLVGRGDAADHAPTDMVLLIDNTGSMNRLLGDATLLDLQLSRALDLLGAARANDRFWVLPAVGPLLASGVASGPAAGAIVRVEQTDATTDLGAGVREALRLLPPGSARQREIVVLSDLQASAIRSTPSDLPSDIRFVISRIAASATNAAVVDLQAEPPGPGGDGAVVVSLAPPDAGTRTDTVEVRLAVSGETVSIARAAAGGSAVLRLPNPGVGEHAISVEIPPSGLRSDDRRHFVLRTFEAPVVRHTGPHDSYVAQALATLERAGRLRLVDAVGGAAAWFAEGVPPDELPGASGSAWIFTPPENDDLLARFNARIDRLGVPWRVDVVDMPGSTNFGSSADVPGLESIRLRGRHQLQSTGSGTDTVLLRTAEGLPWMVAGRAAGSRYLLAASPLVPEHTELPLDAVMLPFMETVLFRWTGLGGVLPAPVPAGVASQLPTSADSVALPDGRRIRVDGGSPYVPLRAGIHTVFLAGGGRSLLAATVPKSESDLAEASVAELTGALGSPEAIVATTGDEWRTEMYGKRRGEPVAPYLVALALVLVLAEAALATPGDKPSPTRQYQPTGNRA